MPANNCAGTHEAEPGAAGPQVAALHHRHPGIRPTVRGRGVLRGTAALTAHSNTSGGNAVYWRQQRHFSISALQQHVRRVAGSTRGGSAHLARRMAWAVLRPAGPPPTMHTSVLIAGSILPAHTKRGGRQLSQLANKLWTAGEAAAAPPPPSTTSTASHRTLQTRINAITAQRASEGRRTRRSVEAKFTHLARATADPGELHRTQ